MKPEEDSLLSARSAAMPSVNALAAPLVSDLIGDARKLRLTVHAGPGGCVVVDAGIGTPGSIEAGRRIAEICLAGLGQVRLLPKGGGRWPWTVAVNSANPVLACLGSQYAGWSLSHGSGEQRFQSLGSGPARALARKEELFGELQYVDVADRTCLVLEVDKPPPLEIVDKVARDCAMAADKLVFILTPTTSIAGITQVVARVLEVALHKAHALGFPLRHIVDGMGAAPLPPPSGNFLTSMGRSNDAILFAGEVQLFVDCDDAAAQKLAVQLPSNASRDYGRPFAEVFKAYEFDFYRIDPLLFAPAYVIVTALQSGNSFRGGAINDSLLDVSFGGRGTC